MELNGLADSVVVGGGEGGEGSIMGVLEESAGGW